MRAMVRSYSPANSSTNVRMSSTRQAVVRGPSFTGSGNRPVLIPAHHVLLLTGIGPFGPRIDFNRTNPVVGSSYFSVVDIGASPFGERWRRLIVFEIVRGRIRLGLNRIAQYSPIR